MANKAAAVYFPFSIIFNLRTVVIDSLRLTFPCDDYWVCSSAFYKTAGYCLDDCFASCENIVWISFKRMYGELLPPPPPLVAKNCRPKHRNCSWSNRNFFNLVHHCEDHLFICFLLVWNFIVHRTCTMFPLQLLFDRHVFYSCNKKISLKAVLTMPVKVRLTSERQIP